MAVNVSQKDEILHKIIDMCAEKHRHYWRVLDDFVLFSNESDPEKVCFLRGKIAAFDECAAECDKMLGHSVSMPSEVSQSEDVR